MKGVNWKRVGLYMVLMLCVLATVVFGGGEITSGGLNVSDGLNVYDGIKVTGAAAGNGQLQINATESNDAVIYMYSDEGDDGNADKYQIKAQTNGYMLFAYNNVNSFGSTPTNNFYTLNNIGVGTNDPANKIHVFMGESGTNPPSSAGLSIEDDTLAKMTILTANTGIGTIEFGDNNDVDRARFYYNHSGDDWVWTLASIRKMVLDNSNGYLGIGSTTPLAPIHAKLSGTQSSLVASAGTVARFENPSTTARVSIVAAPNTYTTIEFSDGDDQDEGKLSYDHANNKFRTYVNGNVATTIDNSRQFGIGTETPSAKLDVVGNVEINGFLGLGTPSSATVINNNITITSSNVIVLGEGSVADQVNCIFGGNEGDIAIIAANLDSSDITFKHDNCPTDPDAKILIDGLADFTTSRGDADYLFCRKSRLAANRGWNCMVTNSLA